MAITIEQLDVSVANYILYKKDVVSYLATLGGVNGNFNLAATTPSTRSLQAKNNWIPRGSNFFTINGPIMDYADEFAFFKQRGGAMYVVAGLNTGASIGVVTNGVSSKPIGNTSASYAVTSGTVLTNPKYTSYGTLIPTVNTTASGTQSALIPPAETILSGCVGGIAGSGVTANIDIGTICAVTAEHTGAYAAGYYVNDTTTYLNGGGGGASYIAGTNLDLNPYLTVSALNDSNIFSVLENDNSFLRINKKFTSTTLPTPHTTSPESRTIMFKFVPPVSYLINNKGSSNFYIGIVFRKSSEVNPGTSVSSTQTTNNTSYPVAYYPAPYDANFSQRVNTNLNLGSSPSPSISVALTDQGTIDPVAPQTVINLPVKFEIRVAKPISAQNVGTILATGDTNLELGATSWVSPLFTVNSPITTLYLKLEFPEDMPADCRIQRILLYHGAGRWNPWNVRRDGDTLFGEHVYSGYTTTNATLNGESNVVTTTAPMTTYKVPPQLTDTTLNPLRNNILTQVLGPTNTVLAKTTADGGITAVALTGTTITATNLKIVNGASTVSVPKTYSRTFIIPNAASGTSTFFWRTSNDVTITRVSVISDTGSSAVKGIMYKGATAITSEAIVETANTGVEAGIVTTGSANVVLANTWVKWSSTATTSPTALVTVTVEYTHN